LYKQITGSYILIKMLDPDYGEIEDFTETLHFLSFNDERVTKKVARNYLVSIGTKLVFNDFTKEDKQVKVQEYIERLNKFIKIDDRLKEHRLEITLGFPVV